MLYGGWLFLLAVGAVLYFAVEDRIPGVDLTEVGLIFMIVAGIGFVVSFVTFLIRRDDARRGQGPYPPP